MRWWQWRKRRVAKAERARRRAEFRDLVLHGYIVDTVDGDRSLRHIFDLRKVDVVWDGDERFIQMKPEPALHEWLLPKGWGL